MKLIDHTVHEFIRDLDSPKPAPGGGSSSAVAAAMGAALSRMVGHLTIPKKKFKKLDTETQEEIIALHEKIKDDVRKFLDLVDDDTRAFNEIMSAFKMSKETEEEKAARSKAIEKATYKATEVPLRIARIAHGVLLRLRPLLEYGNQNAISDIGVGALMLHAGLEGAILNVKINLASLKDEDFKKKTAEEVERLLREGAEESRRIVEEVHGRIG